MTLNKYLVWFGLIGLYVSSLFYILIMMIRNEDIKVRYIMEKKEHHIMISEDNNRLLREVLREIKEVNAKTAMNQKEN